ncbi:SUMF1/EgtB/PvdO family nonheme iron enzyme [Candidatus Uabimicrobium sp. HlEnr_7]|uniref:SUMF1/EgtB/PvdO family nonheme iron enzyme n=1 Tax=Candidatus Uabimicrobium helgolandensis TaxID=3095367 RepID=UPI003556E528
MKKYICALSIFFSVLYAEEVLFVKSGEVDGIYIGSFYLAKKEISNQEFFLFIEEDGYNKKHLWDANALENFSQKFKIENGDQAPRTWKEVSPPAGKEYQAVQGITKAEARAYATNQGWVVPSENMWKLAQKQHKIGDYPWFDDIEENNTGIQLVRYSVSGDALEQRLVSIQKEIKSFASVSQVNRNASSIRDLGRKQKKMQKSVKKFDKDMRVVMDNLQKDKQQELQKLVTTMNSKLLALENQQKQQIEQTMSKWQNQQQYSTNKIKDLTKLVVMNSQEIADLKKDYDLVTNENKDLKKQLQKLQKASVLSKKIDNIQQQLTEQQTLTSNMKNNIEGLNSSVNTQVKSTIQTFKNEQKRWLTSQEKDLNTKTKKWQTKFAQIDELNKDTFELEKQVKKLNSLCPPLPGNNNYVQSMLTLKSGFEEVRLTTKKIQTDLNFLQQKDIAIEQQLPLLKKQDELLAKEDSKIQSTIKNISSRDDNQDKEIAKLDAISGQMEKKTKEINKHIEILQKNDTDTLGTISSIQTILSSQAQKHQSSKQQAREMLTAVTRQKEDIQNLNKNIRLLQNKDSSMDKSLKETANILRGESENIRKKLFSAQQSEVKDIAENTDKNAAEIKGLESYLRNVRSHLQKKMETLESDIKNVEQKRSRLETDFRIAATQMRHNMLEVGQKMLQLFEKGMFIGPIPPEKEIHKKVEEKKPNRNINKNQNPKPIQNAKIAKEELEKLRKEREKFKKEIIQIQKQQNDKMLERIKQTQNIAKQAQQDKSGLVTKIYQDHRKDLAELCYNTSVVFFKNNRIELANSFINMCFKYDANMAIAKNFWNDNWVELNTPNNMVYIPKKLAIFGKQNDFEVPYRKQRIPSFFMDRYEVTRGEFADFVSKAYAKDEFWSKEGKGWRNKRNKPRNWKNPNASEVNLPMINVTYYEAEAYAKWRGKRLPTASEWERAARFIDGRLYPWGDKPPRDGKHFRTNFRQIGMYKDKFPYSAPVGHFKDDLSQEGVSDLCGNVSEWCSSSYKRNNNKKTIKGGSFNSTRYRLQGYFEVGEEPNATAPFIGFRCVKDSPR